MPTKERREKARQRAAQGQIKVEVPVGSPVEIDDQGAPPQEAEATAAIEAARDTMPARAEARIKRYHPEEGKDVYVGVTSPSVVNHRWIMENLGGGHYTVAFYKQKGETRRLEYDSIETFDVDTKIDRKVPPWARTESPAIATAPVHAPGGSNIIDAGVLQLFASMQQSATMQGQMMQAFIERMANQPQTDWVAVLAAAAPIGAALLKMVTDRKDPAAIAAELLEKFKPARQEPAPTGAVAEAFGLFDRFLSIQNRLSPRAPAAAAGEPEDKDIWGFLQGAFPQVVTAYRETLAARAQAAAMAAGRPPAAANGNGAGPGAPAATPPVLGATMVPASPPAISSSSPAAAPPASTPLATPVPAAAASTDAMIPTVAWAPFVQAYVPTLIQWADDRREPEIYAVVLLDTIDKEGRLSVAEPLLNDPAFGAEFLKAFPNARATPARAKWFMDLFSAVREELKPDDDTDDGGEPIGDDETA